jgi:hypothetical protein
MVINVIQSAAIPERTACHCPAVTGSFVRYQLRCQPRVREPVLGRLQVIRSSNVRATPK